MSIKSEIERLGTAKSSLKTAIEGKGVAVPDGIKLDGYGGLVEQISGGGNIHVGTEQPSDPNIDVWINPEGEASTILPPVSTSDNGKFLRVVDGVWAASQLQNAEGVGF